MADHKGSSHFSLTVVVCSHNPKPDFLRRVIDGLRAQTLPTEDWELILIDNCSQAPVRDWADLTWHCNARHVMEGELGLTPARLRGIKESRSPVICFVDDDNVLESNYLDVGLEISKEFPQLGAWGGRISPEFEVAAPAWLIPYLEFLAVRNVPRDMWTNVRQYSFNPPCGAGLFVRSSLAEHYAESLQTDAVRRHLDRRGNSLISGGDTDLVFAAEDLGLGWGIFTRLHLVHLIPARRMERAYIHKLQEAMTVSSSLLLLRRGIPVDYFSPIEYWLRYAGNLVFRGRGTAMHFKADQRARRAAHRLYIELDSKDREV